MPRIKSFVIGILCTFVFAIFVMAKWTLTPVEADRSTPDKAVVYANKVGYSNNPFTEQYFEYQGQNIHFVEAGEGEVVIFLHGFPSYWYSFSRQLEALKNEYHVIAIDGLGAGKSDAPLDIDQYKLENMATQLNALIDHIGADQVHLVGHDWGSAFAIGFSQRFPERILSVTGVSAPPQNVNTHMLQTDDQAKDKAKYVETFKGANPVLIAALGANEQIYDGAYRPLVDGGMLKAEEGQLFRDATSSPRRINAHINWYRANVPHPEEITEADFWPSRDARISVPALYIWGENDRIYYKPAIDRLLSLSDESELIMLTDVGHWPHVRKADVVTKAIRSHLQNARKTD